ncbi:solute carrier organic anion transporter family member 2A1-like isoform X1 [Haliotis rubra]|uniref:solute carrier organic anion transporter family member 2A1-like isoform X1 n=1 Tax=Haliotis rubra TaxID=36100 RepID=UPI001EE5FF8B|nr:solute carrier organic anion transporter family member 2A1-like isoform X1 [Haliotis rubra]
MESINMDLEDTDAKGSMLMLPDSSLKRGWRKQRDGRETTPDDTKCGIGGCTPNCIQCCGTMASFTAVYSFSGLLTTALQIYMATQITALERHFGFSSSVTGFLISCNEIGFVLVTVIVSYCIRKMHIPRLLSLTTLFYGIAGLICVIPFILTRDQINPSTDANVTSKFQTGTLCHLQVTVAPTSKPNSTGKDVCSDTKFSYVEDESMRKIAIAIFALGMIIQGVSKAPRVAGLATYVDDNVPKTKTALYMGIIMGSAICAMAIAFGVAGVFSKIFITFEVTNMTPMHPRWLGAWWLGFLSFGVLAIIFSIPVMCFPRRMRSAEDRPGVKTPVKVTGFLSALVRLVSNPIYFPIIIANCITFFTIGGMMAFFPKYMETQFTLPAWKSNMILGAVGLLSNCAGTIIGGIVTSKMKLSPLTCLKVSVGIVFFSVIVQTLMTFIGCVNPVISKGGTIPRNTTMYIGTNYSTSSSVVSPVGCNSDCGCTDAPYFPMCGADGVNYFSPCHAGCSDFTTNHTFSSCACVTGSIKTATPGLCTPECPMFYVFTAVAVVAGFAMAMGGMPIFISVIRSVSEEDKPVSLGLASFLYTLLGFLPGPIFFGWVIDKACLDWNSGCGGRGACALYDIELFRYLVMGIPAAARVLTLALYVFALCMALRPSSIYRKHEEEQGTKEEIMKMKPR